MPQSSAELMKGTLDLLILRTLDLGAMHGSAIADRIAQVTNGTFQVKAGSLFPALHRLEQQGWLTAEWKDTELGREAKFYALTREGRRQLERELQSWSRLSSAVQLVLERT